LPQGLGPQSIALAFTVTRQQSALRARHAERRRLSHDQQVVQLRQCIVSRHVHGIPADREVPFPGNPNCVDS